MHIDDESELNYNLYILELGCGKMRKKVLKFLVVFIIAVIVIFVGFIIADELNIINIKNNKNDNVIENQNEVTKNSNMDSQNQISNEAKETDFTLVDQYGNEQSLVNYRGKKVVILYWAVWCPPCKEEIPLINELSKEVDDAVFLTIVSPTLGENSEYKTYQEEISTYIKENNIELPVLIDEEKKCFDIYGIERYPTTIFIDEYGSIKEKIGSKEESGKLTKEEIIKKLGEY